MSLVTQNVEEQIYFLAQLAGMLQHTFHIMISSKSWNWVNQGAYVFFGHSLFFHKKWPGGQTYLYAFAKFQTWYIIPSLLFLSLSCSWGVNTKVILYKFLIELYTANLKTVKFYSFMTEFRQNGSRTTILGRSVFFKEKKIYTVRNRTYGKAIQ